MRVWTPFHVYRFYRRYTLWSSQKCQSEWRTELTTSTRQHQIRSMYIMHVHSAVLVSRFQMKNAISPLTFRFFPCTLWLRLPLISTNEQSYISQDSKYVVVVCSCLSICALKELLFVHLNYTTLICIARCVRSAHAMRVCVVREHVFAESCWE